MKKRLLCLLLLLAALTGCSSSQMVVPGQTDDLPKPPAAVTPPGDETAETPEAGEVLPTEDGDSRAQQILKTMTTEQKIYQLFCITPEALTGVGTAVQAGQTTQQALAQYPVGGLFLAVDEEGGTVSRVASNDQMGATQFPPMGQIGATGETEQAYQVGYTIGQELRALGFNLDFAPVADVNSNPQNPVIGTRAFSSDAAVASQMVAAAVQGFTDGGVLCCLKHFPGHGDTATDSHLGYAQTDKTLEQMEQLEFLPFVSGIDAGAPLVMVGHITAPNVTDDGLPASLSHEIITGILRQQLGFQGVVTTDALNMGAITQAYTSGEAAVAALQAGVDLLLMPDDFHAAYDGVLAAVQDGTLSQARIDESVLRILNAKLDAGIIS